MRPIIDPKDDYVNIIDAEQKLAASEAKRKKELEEAHANLKGSPDNIFEDSRSPDLS